MKLKLYQIILLFLTLLLVALGIYAAMKSLGFVSLFAGLFCGQVSTHFFLSLKSEKKKIDI
jgi:hypothetical protein